MKNTPPRLPHRFFRWYCHPKLLKYIEGDLVELYKERVEKSGKRKADLKFIIDVILLFRPGIIRPAEGNQNLNTYGMYKSYLKVGWRNLLRHKGYTAINLAGLASGMAIAALIALWMLDEVSFNQYHQSEQPIARVMQHFPVDGKIRTGAAVPRPLENALRDSYGNNFSRMAMATWTNDHILTAGEVAISQKGTYVQSDFPEMFAFRMIAGTSRGLESPNSILISASTAHALFGTASAINKLIRIDNAQDVTVTGVYEDMPHNSTFNDLKFISTWDLFIEAANWTKRAATQWDNNSFIFFVQLAPGHNVDEVSGKIADARAEHSKNADDHTKVFLHSMENWHLRADWKNGINTGGRIQLIILFGTIGIFVLLLACINFMNLSTARSEKRAKEVGIRMTIGSVRGQLVNQFLSESFLVVFLSFLLTVAIVVLTLPAFNLLADKHIVINWLSPVLWVSSAAFIILTSLLAGSYPAFYLSSFKPISVLKNSFKSGRFSSLPRKILVVVQCTVSVTLVIGTIVVYQQVQHTKNRPTGYDQNGLVMIRMKSRDFYGKYDALRTELKNIGAIEEMSESSSPMTSIWQNSGGFEWQGKNPETQSSDFGTIYVTQEYGKTVDWKVKEGRDFLHSDSSAILINQAAVDFMGVKNPVGMQISWGERTFQVVGVVDNLVMDSPYSPVRHCIYMLNPDNANWINLKLNASKSPGECIGLVEGVFKKLVPSAPFDYNFVDVEYAQKFNSEERIGKLSYVFAILATFISCLGLIGLSSFVAEQYTKEIGIRKIMGASLIQLWRLLSSDFFILVSLSSVFAVTISYYFMNQWLETYTYRVTISWQTFALTVAGGLLLTLLTVSYQAIRAAMANPVKSLRNE